MAHHEEGGPVVAARRLQERERFAGPRSIEVSGRLVGKNEFRTCGECASERHPLLLADGKLFRSMIQAPCEADFFEERCRQLSVRPQAEEHSQEDVFESREPRQKLKGLKHVPDRTGAESISSILRKRGNIDALEENASRSGAQDPRDTMKERGLPRAAFAGQGNLFSRIHRKMRYIQDYLLGSVRRAVALQEVFDSEEHAYFSAPCGSATVGRTSSSTEWATRR